MHFGKAHIAGVKRKRILNVSKFFNIKEIQELPITRNLFGLR
jgi:hypothetical protein